MRFVALLVCIMFLSGCMTVKTYTVEKPRTDTDVYGNRGFLTGSYQDSDKEKKSRLGPTRKISVFEVEYGPRSLEDDGQVQKTPVKEVPFDDEYQDSSSEDVDYDDDVLMMGEMEEEEFQYYTVGKNDTLQKISHKFYGTTRKWNKLFEANRDVLKNPDRVYPGTKLKIPAL